MNDLLYLTVKELAEVIGAQLPFGFIDKPLLSVAIDSRKVVEGDIFFGLPGEHIHGQIFAKKAFELGASAIIIEDLKAACGDGCEIENLMVVKSAEIALQQAASAVREKLENDRQIIGITGSNGKTTTKEVVAAVLAQAVHLSPSVASSQGATSSQEATVYFSRGNFNNHLGLPVSLLSAPKKATKLVFELGMSNPGEIDFLANILKPHIGVITNVGGAHLETMGTIENVALAKAELISHLPEDGLLLLNSNCQWSSFLASRYGGRIGFVEVVDCLDTSGEVKGFGLSDDDTAKSDKPKDVQLSDHMQFSALFTAKELACDYVSGNLHISWNGSKIFIESVKIPVSGIHLISSYLFAVLIALELEAISIPVIEASQSSLEFVQHLFIKTNVAGRMETTVVNDINIINDGYNANPSSVIAAVKYLAHLQVNEKNLQNSESSSQKTGNRLECSGKGIASSGNSSSFKIVLGEMLELGSDSSRFHYEVAREAALLLGKENVFLLGEVYVQVAADFGTFYAKSIEEMACIAGKQFQSGDTVLLKASRGVAIEGLIKLLNSQ